MRKLLSLLLILCLLLPAAVLGEEAAPAETAPADAASAADAQAAPGQDNLSVTRHTATIAGKQIDYTATAGTMAMETELGKYEIFFIAYTVDGTEDYSKRPVTFAFNGGPGSASLWLNLGLLGPERIDLSDEGMLKQAVTGTKPNEYSILDMTDLVFIDPVGTGFSGVLPGTDEETFYTYDNDITSVGDFIRLYVSRYGRWSSPKYVAGESYGTTRAIGVCDYLRDTHHLNLNGLILISTANDFAALETTPGNEMPYVHFLPSFAAAAWYHKKAAEQYLNMSLEDYLEEVKAFASGEYLSALYRGSRLSGEEKKDIAEKMAGYIGLNQDYILKHNLRLDLEDFAPELLGDQKLMIGRIDSRYTGPVVEGSLGSGSSDPSSLGISEAFAGAMNDYVARELQYTTDKPYEVLSNEINKQWDFNTKNQALAQEDVIYKDMSANQFLKVWVVCGYYDLATPFYAAEWVYSHIFLNEELEKNLTFSYYPAGHMFYLLSSSLADFRKDAEAWFNP